MLFLKQLNIKKILLSTSLVMILLVIGFGSWLYFIELPKYFFKVNPNYSQKKAFPSFDQSLELTLKKTFSDEQYSDIRTYLSLASAENKDLTARYNYLVRAYRKMDIAYTKTKNDNFKKALTLLKNHLSVFPQYNKNAFL